MYCRKKIRILAAAALMIISVALSIGYIMIKHGSSYESRSGVEINKMTGVRINDLINEAAEKEKKKPFVITFGNVLTLNTMDDYQQYLYTIDKSAYVDKTDIDLEGFLDMDFKTNLWGREPKILIFHTHSQEAFVDSREGAEEDTIVGMGQLLAEILALNYNIPVVHDVGQYDVSRGDSYEKMEPAVRKILEKYPSIEVMIDLHRDGVPDNVKFVTEIDGKPTAMLMLFNGVTKENKNGKPKEIADLYNPFLRENLALSLQTYLNGNEMYPGLMRRIYIKPYRYSLHMMPKSLLIEAGANTNTVEEVRNAMHPLAAMLVRTLGGKR